MEKPVTLITGTSKGIGNHLAQHYLSLGHRVIGCSRGAFEIGDPQYLHFEVDVCDEGAVRDLCMDVRKSFGRIDHVINNAGIASMNHSLLTPADTVERILRTNVLGTFVLAREAAKVMRVKKFGRVVNFSTVAVPYRLEGEAAYVASKAAVEALTRVMSRELAPFGVTVNAVGPVPIATDLIRSVPEEKIAALIDRQAIPRMGKFDDVANVVDFFLRPESEFVTGQVLYLGGA